MKRTASLVSHVQFFLYGFLPRLLPPEQLSELTPTYYGHSYRALQNEFHPKAHKLTLEDWEVDVVTRHLAMADTVVVLGAELGRESLVLARQGHRCWGSTTTMKDCRSPADMLSQRDFRLPCQSCHNRYAGLGPSIISHRYHKTTPLQTLPDQSIPEVPVGVNDRFQPDHASHPCGPSPSRNLYP